MREEDGAPAGGAASHRRTLLRDDDAGGRLRGILLILVSSMLFTALDTTAKLVAQRGVPVLEVVWVRYAVHFALAAIILNPLISPASWRTAKPVQQAVRALALCACTAFNFIAIQYLQLAQTVTISFLGPLVIATLSFFLFGEAIGPKRLGAILVGFVGILIVAQPGLAGFHPAMLVSILSMLCYSVYALMTRALAGTETPGSMILVVAGVPALALAPFMPAVWTTPDDPAVFALMAVLGVTGGLGHFLVILAHRYATAATLAPFNYVQIVYMTLSGYLVFSDVPATTTLVGGAVVIGSGLYLLHRERVRRAPASDAPRAG